MTKAEFQRVLDDMAEAFVTNDFGAYAACVVLPFTIIRNRGHDTFADEKALRVMFDDYVEGLKLNSVDQIVRVSHGFEDCRDGTYIGNAETHFLSKGRRIAEPHTSAFLIKITDQGAKVMSILASRAAHEATQIAPIIWET